MGDATPQIPPMYWVLWSLTFTHQSTGVLNTAQTSLKSQTIFLKSPTALRCKTLIPQRFRRASVSVRSSRRERLNSGYGCRLTLGRMAHCIRQKSRAKLFNDWDRLSKRPYRIQFCSVLHVWTLLIAFPANSESLGFNYSLVPIVRFCKSLQDVQNMLLVLASLQASLRQF